MYDSERSFVEWTAEEGGVSDLEVSKDIINYLKPFVESARKKSGQEIAKRKGWNLLCNMRRTLERIMNDEAPRLLLPKEDMVFITNFARRYSSDN